MISTCIVLLAKYVAAASVSTRLIAWVVLVETVNNVLWANVAVTMGNAKIPQIA